ncbi:MAG: T9SS type A sorting domain-containing protein [Bacteroidota bacterium]
MFKTKFTIIVTLYTLLISSSQTYSQSYSVWFIGLSNGQTVANVFSQTQVAVNVTFNASGTRHQYHRAWKFILRTNVGDYTLTFQPIPYPQVFPPLSFPTVYTPSGNFTWTLEMREVLVLGDEYLRAQTSVNFNTKFTIYAENNFSGGQILLEGSQQTSGASVLKFAGESASVSAIDQNDGVGYDRIWNTVGNTSNWKFRRHQGSETTINGASSRNYNYTVANNDNGITLIADLKRVCSLTFQANSSMSINGNYRTSPYTESVVEQNSISALASIYSANGIDFTFSKWSSSGGDFFSPVTATEHKTYTAVYTGKPNNNYRSITFNTSQEGQPVQVTWSKHPLDNSDITHYAVYRKVTTSGTPTLLTTVSATGSSSYTYTDYEYAISSGENKILLFYDVRAYYSPSSSYSDPSFEGVYGVYNISKQPDEVTYNQTSLELPATMTVSNYPNPFNPTTTISYQLPEQSFVTLKVFDILGREVATLVNEHKPAGMYNVTFNARHPGQSREITSGVYIYTLSANGFVLSKKMLLAK